MRYGSTMSMFLIQKDSQVGTNNAEIAFFFQRVVTPHENFTDFPTMVVLIFGRPCLFSAL